MTLVTYFSRTGTTKKIALEIADRLGAEVDPIFSDEYKGISGWIKGGFHAVKARTTEISFSKSANDYDLVIIGTPIWAGTVTPPVRAYLEKNNFKKVAFFCTCGDKQVKAFSEMEKLSKQPIAVLELKTVSVKSENYQKELIEFTEKLK